MKLTRRLPDGSDQTHELPADAVLLGRQPRTGITIDDPTVSREHARIFARDATFHVADLNSSNGTFVNGKRVTRSELKPGDRLRLGEVELTVAGDGDAVTGAGELRLDDAFFESAPRATTQAPDAPEASDPHGAPRPPQGRAPAGADRTEEIALDEGPQTSAFATPLPPSKSRGAAVRPGAGPAPRRPVSTQAMLSRPADAREQRNVLGDDLAQYSPLARFGLLLLVLGVAYGLYLLATRVTEAVVPEGDLPGATAVEPPADGG